MGTMQTTAPSTLQPPCNSTEPVSRRRLLPAKGSCWYCAKPLDAVRRFCGKACAEEYEEEEDFTQGLSQNE